MLEVMSSDDTSTGYSAEKVSGKKNKFVRSRVKEKSYISRGDSYYDDPYFEEPGINDPATYTDVGDPNLKPVSNLDGEPKVEPVDGYVPPASNAMDDSAPTIYSFGVHVANSTKESVFHGGVTLGIQLDPVDILLGASIFNSDKAYWGFDVGARVDLFQLGSLAPFVGAGAYLGDSKRCESELVGSDVVETCEKFFLATVYPEAGIKYTFNGGTEMALFVRDYSSTSQDIVDRRAQLIGISILGR